MKPPASPLARKGPPVLATADPVEVRSQPIRSGTRCREAIAVSRHGRTDGIDGASGGEFSRGRRPESIDNAVFLGVERELLAMQALQRLDASPRLGRAGWACSSKLAAAFMKSG
jgi:hypothetical protein